MDNITVTHTQPQAKNIIHIGNYNLVRKRPKAGTPAFFSTDYKLMRASIRLGHNTLSFDERSHIAQYPRIPGVQGLAAKKMNRELLRWIDVHESEMLVVGHAEQIPLETFLACKQNHPNIKIIGWWVDTVNPEHPGFTVAKQNLLRARLELFDALYVTTSPNTLAGHLGISTPPNLHFMPNPCELATEKYTSFNSNHHTANLFYAASTNQYRQALEHTLDQLNTSKSMFMRGKKVFGQAYYHQMSQCKAGINISSVADTLYSSDRMIQITGNGLLLISERFTGCELLFGHDEAVYFESPDELVDIIAVLDTDAWRQMAEKAWRRSHSEYSVDVILQSMLDGQPIHARFI